MDDGSEMAGCAVGGRTQNCVSSFFPFKQQQEAAEMNREFD
jgi:hypothetical protein